VALQLSTRGIARVRPLEGRLDSWVADGYALEKIGILAAAKA